MQLIKFVSLQRDFNRDDSQKELVIVVQVDVFFFFKLRFLCHTSSLLLLDNKQRRAIEIIAVAISKSVL